MRTTAIALIFSGVCGALLLFRGATAVSAEPTSSTAGQTLRPEAFGAIGDGVADDTAALQKALDALHAGDTLALDAGKTYRHTDVLTVRVAGARVSGPGTLLATNEARSDVRIDADNVTLDGGLTLKMASTTRRWDAYEQMKLRLSGGHTGITLRHITVDGSAAAGIYIGNACAHYLLEDVTVENTRADGIHNTGGSHDGTIRRPVIRNVGDDGVAVVSYERDGSPCHDITVESPRFYGNVWGRAFSVVGGEDITYRDIYAENSNAAAVYIASEGAPYNTAPTRRIHVLGGELRNSNTNKKTDHGAVLIYSGRPGYANDDIEIADLRITDTRMTASRQVGVLGDAHRVTLRHFTFLGGPANLFSATAPPSAYNTVGWERLTPTPVADHVGYSISTP